MLIKDKPACFFTLFEVKISQSVDKCRLADVGHANDQQMIVCLLEKVFIQIKKT